MASLCDGLVLDGYRILTLSAKLAPHAHLKSIFIFPWRGAAYEHRYNMRRQEILTEDNY